MKFDDPNVEIVKGKKEMKDFVVDQRISSKHKPLSFTSQKSQEYPPPSPDPHEQLSEHNHSSDNLDDMPIDDLPAVNSEEMNEEGKEEGKEEGNEEGKEEPENEDYKMKEDDFLENAKESKKEVEEGEGEVDEEEEGEDWDEEDSDELIDNSALSELVFGETDPSENISQEGLLYSIKLLAQNLITSYEVVQANGDPNPFTNLQHSSPMFDIISKIVLEKMEELISTTLDCAIYKSTKVKQLKSQGTHETVTTAAHALGFPPR